MLSRVRILKACKKNYKRQGVPKGSLACIGFYAKKTVNVFGDSYYFTAEKRGIIETVVAGILSHETLHPALGKIAGYKAFLALDKISPAYRLKWAVFHIDGLGLDAPNSGINLRAGANLSPEKRRLARAVLADMRDDCEEINGALTWDDEADEIDGD